LQDVDLQRTLIMLKKNESLNSMVQEKPKDLSIDLEEEQQGFEGHNDLNLPILKLKCVYKRKSSNIYVVHHSARINNKRQFIVNERRLLE
jgi:hypothetical protein